MLKSRPPWDAERYCDEDAPTLGPWAEVCAGEQSVTGTCRKPAQDPGLGSCRGGWPGKSSEALILGRQGRNCHLPSVLRWLPLGNQCRWRGEGRLPRAQTMQTVAPGAQAVCSSAWLSDGCRAPGAHPSPGHNKGQPAAKGRRLPTPRTGLPSRCLRVPGQPPGAGVPGKGVLGSSRRRAAGRLVPAEGARRAPYLSSPSARAPPGSRRVQGSLPGHPLPSGRRGNLRGEPAGAVSRWGRPHSRGLLGPAPLPAPLGRKKGGASEFSFSVQAGEKLVALKRQSPKACLEFWTILFTC